MESSGGQAEQGNKKWEGKILQRNNKNNHLSPCRPVQTNTHCLV